MKNTRRDFLKIGAAGTAAGLVARRAAAAIPQQAPAADAPNFLFINVDQWSLDCIGANGNPHVKTPNVDRMIREGLQFKQAYTANPVCGPARAAWFTSRAPSETGCLFNGIPIGSETIPDFGQWFSQAGYETVHMGKWHFAGREQYNSFEKVPVGSAMGEHLDPCVARTMAGFMDARVDNSRPFLAVLGLHNPHDCCEWWTYNAQVPSEFPLPDIEADLPPMPPNFDVFPEPEPFNVRKVYRPLDRAKNWDKQWWQFYLWSYYRYIEMVDEEIGYILDALNRSPHRDSTLVVLTADHGDGHGCHTMNGKQYLYEDVCNVPFVVYGPGFVRQSGREDADHLVSTMDIFPTLCDYAGIRPPQIIRGESIRPLIENIRPAKWRDFVRVETIGTGRMVRDSRYNFKYIEYHGDPVVQLFDLQNDPWETRNLASEPEYAPQLKKLRADLAAYEAQLETAPVHPKAQKLIAREMSGLSAAEDI